MTRQAIYDELKQAGVKNISRKSRAELLELQKSNEELLTKQPQKVKSTEQNTVQSRYKGTSNLKEIKIPEPKPTSKKIIQKIPERIKDTNTDIQERIN